MYLKIARNFVNSSTHLVSDRNDDESMPLDTPMEGGMIWQCSKYLMTDRHYRRKAPSDIFFEREHSILVKRFELEITCDSTLETCIDTVVRSCHDKRAQSILVLLVAL